MIILNLKTQKYRNGLKVKRWNRKELLRFMSTTMILVMMILLWSQRRSVWLCEQKWSGFIKPQFDDAFDLELRGCSQSRDRMAIDKRISCS
ncbi:hypothetical protein CS542_03810 [Pedobacter sp. IW39]|nr:hypothetical protein CS542_03810 [Pedobacter sp. IW39]